MVGLDVIPHNYTTLGHDEQAAAVKVIRSGWVAQGIEVAAFENRVCQFLNIPEGHAVAVSSGTAALYLALWALEANNKRVALPVYSCTALRNAVGLIGAIPIYLDCASESPNTGVPDSGYSDIDILIAVSMFGIPIDLKKTEAVENKYKIIEDIAQSFGSSLRGEKIGLRGDLGICSFYATKMMTTGGQGGIVVSKDKSLVDRIRDYREFDCRSDSINRFNFQMTDIQAAIGIAQLDRLPMFIDQREKWFSIYKNSGLNLIDASPHAQPVRYRIVMRCINPLGVIERLSKAGVKAIVPIDAYELLDHSKIYKEALKMTCTTVSLPAFPSLMESDVIQIARIARDAK